MSGSNTHCVSPQGSKIVFGQKTSATQARAAMNDIYYREKAQRWLLLILLRSKTKFYSNTGLTSVCEPVED